ncbi:hypothetical protein WICPIJ_006952 [Wickerhamomyces pijperi]|uniref:Altered inheritance of mitochondria protein 32 n=1 Tax=Wickerhamomyces pijperi TaxID=599730 RepID=A0A9P8TJQ1_WICPI|nr:hypothetical protein WICPIJ_006952 [Wickerhamomyces pijperi]
MRFTLPLLNVNTVLSKTRLKPKLTETYTFLRKPYHFPTTSSHKSLSSPLIQTQFCDECATTLPTDKQLSDRALKPLNSTTAPHWKHVLIHSKVKAKDWGSKVELMPSELISEFGRLIRNSTDPFHPVLVSNVELEIPEPLQEHPLNEDESWVLVYPENEYYKLNKDQVEEFMLEKLNPNTSATPSKTQFKPYTNSQELILICGHAKRDIRCEIASSYLQPEFNHSVSHHSLSSRVKVGLISHIGGHVYAGNVIYFDQRGLALWYGRVEPLHVDSIVRESVIAENVITELYRGRVPDQSE